MMRCLALAVLAGTLIAHAADPPPPDLKNPVDYVAWVNAGFMKDLTDNAAERYKQAIAALVNDEELSKLAGTPAREWTAEQREKLNAWVERNRDALEELAAAAAKRRCYFELRSTTGSLVEVMLPELGELRKLARLLATRAELRLAAGDADGTVQDAVTLIGIARHLESQPMLISYLVALAVRSLAYSVLMDLPAVAGEKANFDAQVTRVEQADADPKSPKRQFTMEKIIAWDAAQRFLKDTNADGRFDRLELPNLGESGAGPVTLNRPQTLEEILRIVNECYADLDSAASMEYPQARAAFAKLDERVAAAKGSFINVMLPSFSRATLMYTRVTALRRGTLLVLRLHAHRAKNGHWPADLKAVLPANGQLLGTDPFSGQPFVYRLEKDEPRLYSVSENGKDDGGEVFKKDGKPAWGETGDYVFWPPTR